MTRFTITLASFFTGLPAFADPGHVAERAGHSHVADYGLMALVAAAAAVAAIRFVASRHLR